jgi:anti-anti-sigma factor
MTAEPTPPQPAPFDADGTLDGDAYLLRLGGEFDLAALPAAQAAVDTSFQVVWKRMRLDCSSLEFIDSSGLRFVVELHERCRAERRELSIAPGPAAVQRVFEITGMDAHLPFEA